MKKIVILFLIGFSLQIYSQNIVDKGQFFTALEVKKLDSILNDFQHKTKIPVLLYTIPFLDAYTTVEYVTEFIYEDKSLKIPPKPHNNSLVIIMSKEDRKLNLIPAYGLEWQLSDQKSKRIVDQMVPCFMRHRYTKGIFKGIKLLENQIGEINWEIVEKPLDLLRKKEVAKIVKFDYQNPDYTENPDDEWDYYEEPDPDAPQFSKNYLLKIPSAKGDFNLFYTKNMKALIDSIQKRPKTTIYARFVDWKTKRLELIGIE